jgi:hypothetical protein
MYIPKRRKNGHAMNKVSKKSVNRFIERGLRIIAAKPVLYYHQTLSFPKPIIETKDAKKIFVKFIKQVLKAYRDNEMSIHYVQERRRNGTIHYHVSFLFFDADKLPYAKSRRYRDFRTDIFNRWNRFNDLKAVRVANKLKEHLYDFDSINYFAKGLVVSEGSTERSETNWWGTYNKEYILNRTTAPTKNEVKFAFGIFFKKSSRNHCTVKPSRMKDGVCIGKIPEAVSVSVVCDYALPVDRRS